MTVNPEPTPTADATAPTFPTAASTPAGAMEHQPVATGGNRRVGKTRNPIAVWLLTFVTLGIYGIYWYYKVNDEARDYDRSIEVTPVLSVLAMFVPIVGWVSVYRCGGRIGQAQRSAGRPDTCSGVIGLVLTFVFGLWVVYYQSELNKVWESHGSPEPGTTV